MVPIKHENLFIQSLTIDELKNAGLPIILSREQLKRWRETSSSGDEERFIKRLAWDKFSLSDFESTYTDNESQNSILSPFWKSTFEELLGFSVDVQTELEKKYEGHIPFEEIITPWLGISRSMLFDALGADNLEVILNRSHMSLGAFADLEKDLCSRLSVICSETLYEEFFVFRPLELSRLALKEKLDTKSRKYYLKFIRYTLENNYLPIFHKYPVLTRLIATCIRLWTNTTTEFIKRLEKDWEEIGKIISGSNGDMGSIIKITSSISDPHKGGRGIKILELTSGEKIVYKPRNLSMDVAFNELLDWVNRNQNQTKLRLTKILFRSDYGWCEYIPHQQCKSLQEVRNYYFRSGMLLFLLYVVCANDFHHENIICMGEQPVLIDLESLFHHRTLLFDEALEGAKSDIIIDDSYWLSVLRIGLLPQWSFEISDPNTVYDISGLGGIDEVVITKKEIIWKNINSDGMYFSHDNIRSLPRKNTVYLGNNLQRPEDFLECLLDGFTLAYNLFSDKKSESYFSDGGPLSQFRKLKSRYIFRPTNVYSMILRHSLLPNYLTSGIDFCIELEYLARAYLFSPEFNSSWLLFHEELLSLIQLDIPHFDAYVNENKLKFRDNELLDLLKEPSVQTSQSIISNLGASDLAHQIMLIKSAFHARIATSETMIDNSKMKIDSFQAKIADNDWLNISSEIYKKFRNSAYRGEDGSISWSSLTPIPGGNRFIFQPIFNGLYSGECGVAIFLAALGKAISDPVLIENAFGTIKPLITQLNTSNSSFIESIIRRIGLGGGTGLGSVMYSIIKISQILEKSELIGDALKISELITEERIRRSNDYDVIGGLAGTILGFLAIYNEYPDEKLLEKASICADHLLENRLIVKKLPPAWILPGEKVPLTGFSHGAAGISLTLAKLFSVTNDHRYFHAAIDAIEYENTFYSEENKNWADLRGKATIDPPFEFTTAWCNGATGIGIARLGCLKILPNEFLLRDIEIALNITETTPFSVIDHLCCGNFGRVEFFLAAGIKLESEKYISKAKRMAELLIKRSKKIGGFQIFDNLPPQVYSIGFFQGLSGIGYEMLRIVNPKLPSILLWD